MLKGIQVLLDLINSDPEYVRAWNERLKQPLPEIDEDEFDGPHPKDSFYEKTGLKAGEPECDEQTQDDILKAYGIEPWELYYTEPPKPLAADRSIVPYENPLSTERSIIPYEMPPGEARTTPADLLAFLADQINGRETVLIKTSLDLVWAQGEDLLRSWEETQRLDRSFPRWVKEYIKKFKYKRACHYVQFRRTYFTRHDKPDDEMWKVWQKISGNKAKKVLPGNGKDKTKKTTGGPAPKPTNKRQIDFPPAITDEAGEAAYYQHRDGLRLRFPDKTDGEITLLAYQRLYEQECGDGKTN